MKKLKKLKRKVLREIAVIPCAKKHKVSQRKPGLLHGPRRVEIQEVRKAHKRECSLCTTLPKKLRLFVIDGGGRNAKTFVFCQSCGTDCLRLMINTYNRADQCLWDGLLEPVREWSSIAAWIEAEHAKKSE